MTQVPAYAARSAAHSLAPFDIERRARRQAQMREYPDNHRRLFDGGDDLQGAATLRAVFDVDSENALEQTRPAHTCRCFIRVVSRIIARFLRCARHNRGAEPK